MLGLTKARKARLVLFSPEFDIFREQRQYGEQRGHRRTILDLSQELVTQITLKVLIFFITKKAS